MVLVILVKKLTLEMLEVDLEVIPELLTVQLGGQNLQPLDHLQAVDLLDVLRVLLPVELKKEIQNVGITDKHGGLTRMSPYKSAMFFAGIWSWLADKLHFILDFISHPPFCRITAYATMPG